MVDYRCVLRGLALLVPACAGPRVEPGTVEIPPPAPVSAAEATPEPTAARPPRPPPAASAPRPEGSTTQAATAEDLFRQAKTAMASRAYGQACALFAESLRLDWAMGTLLNLAE